MSTSGSRACPKNSRSRPAPSLKKPVLPSKTPAGAFARSGKNWPISTTRRTRPPKRSRLGWELQDLRDRLRLQLAQLEGRLLDEVGVSFRRAGKSRGCNSMIRQDVIHTYSLQETLEPCP